MLKYFYLDRSMTENIIDNQEGTLEQAGEGKLTFTNYWKSVAWGLLTSSKSFSTKWLDQKIEVDHFLEFRLGYIGKGKR